MKTQLTIEQSANLISKGVSADKASDVKIVECGCKSNGDGFYKTTPIYTLSDLLEILPKEIEIDTCQCGLSIWYHNANYWIVSYVQYSGSEISYQAMPHESEELIDALYNLALECADKSYLNKE